MKNAMIFAAGLGTRLKPLTDRTPKALVKAGEKTLLEIIISKLKREGFRFIIVNVHHFADQIEDFLRANNNFGIDIRISDERECLLDTGGAIKKACNLFNNEDFLIHNVDILSNADLSALFEKHISEGNYASLLVSERKSSRKLVFTEDNLLCGWKNELNGECKWPWGKSTPKNTKELAFSGIHVFSPRLAPYMDKFPEVFPIVDFYLETCQSCKIKAIEDPNLHISDVGKISTLHEAESLLSKGFFNDPTFQSR